MHMTVQQMMANSFVISCNEEKLRFLRRNFTREGLAPLPRFVRGFSVHQGACSDLIKYVYRESRFNCGVSHGMVVSMAAALDLPFVCVFEDDAYPCRGAFDKLASVLSDLPDSLAVLKIGWGFARHARMTRWEKDPRFCTHQTWGSHAYVLFRRMYDHYYDIFTNHTVIPDTWCLNHHSIHEGFDGEILGLSEPVFTQKNETAPSHHMLLSLPNIEDFTVEQDPVVTSEDEMKMLNAEPLKGSFSWT